MNAHLLSSNLPNIFADLITPITSPPSLCLLSSIPTAKPQAREILVKEWGEVAKGQRDQQVDSMDAFVYVQATTSALITVIGFALLRPSARDPVGAKTALVSSLIIDKPYRGKGFGKAMAMELENEARNRQYMYISVWASPTERPFYESLGYHVMMTNSINASYAVLNKSSLVLGPLERMLQRKTAETLHQDMDVCLRKRLVERITPTYRTPQQLIEIVMEELHGLSPHDTRWSNVQMITQVLAWERQIGPSCGLAALRIAARALLPNNDLEDRMDGLLAVAQHQGYSSDGEFFNIDNLASLAREAFPKELLQVTVQDFSFIVTNITKIENQLLIVPYDKGSGTGRPELKQGLTAHYCVIFAHAFDDQTQQHALIATHGASSRLVAAWAKEWMMSNSQLYTRDTSRYVDELDTGMNLAGKCIVVGTPPPTTE